MQIRLFLAFILFVLTTPSFAQQHSLLYEVSGNGLKKPSYLFGTFHLLTSSFVDSQKVVIKKIKACDAVAGEIDTDSLTFASMRMFSTLHADTPLDKLLSPTAYVELNAWTYELLGTDLTFFKNMPPAIINALLMQMVYVKNMNPPSGEKPMDMYIQNYARKHKKKVFPLESIQTQMDALFNQPLKRQAAQLEKFVIEKDSAVKEIQTLVSLYRHADYDKLQAMMYDTTEYNPEEIKTLLTDRNAAWLKLLPSMMTAQPTFVAVGAMHLAGENGLVAGLKKQGYMVTPLPLR